MKKWILFSFCTISLYAAAPLLGSDLLPLETPTISEESLFVRRIIEFWKDEDYTLVKAQIKQFFTLYPQSEFSDGLNAILGDVYWNEESFQQALEAYDLISANSYIQKVFSKKLDCLYQLKLYTTLIESVRPHLPHDSYISSEQALWVFYYAEALVYLAKEQQDPSIAQQYYRLARTSYESLLSTSHADNAKVALSDVYKALKLPQEAIACYLELAEKQLDRREDFLFEAACMQATHHSQQAMATFLSIEQMGGKRASDAIFWRIRLLFNQGNHLELIKESERCIHLLSLQQKAWCYFFLGKTYGSLNDHEKALQYLQPLLISSYEFKSIPIDARPDEKTVLKLLIHSAHQLNELAMLENWCQRYESTFPQDPALPQINYFLALTYKNCDRFQESQEILETMVKSSLSFEKIELVHLENAKLLFQLQKWRECRAMSEAFLDKYSNPEHCYQIHLLITLCCQKGEKDIDTYIRHAEHALAMKPNTTESSSLHAGLFQAYLLQIQLNPHTSQVEMDKAMDHLLAACEIKPEILQDLYKYYASASESIVQQHAQIIFSLAGVLEHTGAFQQAQQLYNKILNTKNISPVITAATQLNLARLNFSTIPLEQRSLENPELLKILQTLKDLQIRKLLVQEPVHLEAALEYATIRSSIEPTPTQQEQLLFYLQRAKDEFTLSQDLCSRDYYASCQQHPEKARVYQTYLLLFDAYIARLRGKIAHNEGKQLAGDTSLAIAQKLFEEALQAPILSAYRLEKIKKQEI